MMKPTTSPFAPALLVVLGLSLAVRLIGLGWGIPAYTADLMPNTPYRSSYHLDEDNFLSGLMQMRPAAGNFDVLDYHWGTLQFYLIYGVLEAAQVARVIPTPWEAAYQEGNLDVLPRLYILGRLVSVAAALAATLAAVALGSALGGRAAGLAAGTAYALAPLAVVEAHYLTNDVSMSAFVIGAVWAAVVGVQRGRRGWLVLAGLLLGLGVAAKYSAAFAAPALLSAQIALWRRRALASRPAPLGGGAQDDTPLPAREQGRWVRRIADAFGPWLATAGGFILGEPYILVKPSSVWRGLQDTAQGNALDAAGGVRAALGMLRWQITNLAAFGLTWPLAGLAALGLAFMLARIWRSRRAAARAATGRVSSQARSIPGNGGDGAPTSTAIVGYVVLLVAIAGLAGGLMLNRVFVLRYTQPLIPLLAVAAGVGWAALPRGWARAGAGGLAVLGAGVVTWGQLALLSGPHPADELLAWLGAHLQPGQVVARAWPEYPVLDGTRYTLLRMDPWQPDLPADARPDYIVMDNMQFGPPTAAVTQRLARDYAVVARFSARPALGPFAWDEGTTPHDWKYSHPAFVVYMRRAP